MPFAPRFHMTDLRKRKTNESTIYSSYTGCSKDEEVILYFLDLGNAIFVAFHESHGRFESLLDLWVDVVERG